MLYVLLRELCRWLLLLACSARTARLPRRLPPGGFVLASNHQSYLDPILLGASLRRPISFMARDTLFKNPLFGGLIRRVHAFPVRRDRVGKEGLREAETRLRAGSPVVVFVEGTRSQDGSIGTVKDGAGLLSRLADVPVVPAAVDTFRAWPRKRAFPLPAPVRVAFGKAIPAARFREDPDGARAQLETEIRGLHRTLMRRSSR